MELPIEFDMGVPEGSEKQSCNHPRPVWVGLPIEFDLKYVQSCSHPRPIMGGVQIELNIKVQGNINRAIIHVPLSGVAS